MTDPTIQAPEPTPDPVEPEGGGSMGDSGGHGDADPLSTAEADNYRRALAGGSTIHEPEPEGE